MSAVKLADDRSGDVIVRVYESRGERATTDLSLGFAHGEVSVVNLLERTDGESETLTEIEPTEGGVRVQLRAVPDRDTPRVARSRSGANL